MKRVIPGNTLQSRRWAVNTFITWAKQRNERMPEEQIELDILSDPSSPECLCYVLQLFAHEVRKVNGDK